MWKLWKIYVRVRLRIDYESCIQPEYNFNFFFSNKGNWKIANYIFFVYFVRIISIANNARNILHCSFLKLFNNINSAVRKKVRKFFVQHSRLNYICIITSYKSKYVDDILIASLMNHFKLETKFKQATQVLGLYILLLITRMQRKESMMFSGVSCCVFKFINFLCNF